MRHIGRVTAIVFILVIAACADDASTSVADVNPPTTMQADEMDDHMEEPGHADDEGHSDEGTPSEGGVEEYIPEAVGAVDAEYTVVLTDFAFEADFTELEPGSTVRFTLTNEGVIPHEFRLTTEHKIGEHLAAGHDHTAASDHELPDILVYLEAGETKVVEMTLPADAGAIDVIACLIEGHYEVGMFETISF